MKYLGSRDGQSLFQGSSLRAACRVPTRVYFGFDAGIPAAANVKFTPTDFRRYLNYDDRYRVSNW